MPERVLGPRVVDRAFFAGDARRLARRLIGHVLVRALAPDVLVAGVIVETEAYLGVRDAASHAYGGRRTARTEPMFAQPGTAYVYFTYGMHHCFNVVCGAVDVPAAVLIRAVRPVMGVELMRANRRGDGARMIRDEELCSGPARLCQAMQIDRRLSGVDLVESGEIWICGSVEDRLPGRRAIAVGPRIGVAYAGAWAEEALRYWLKGDANVSLGSGRLNGRAKAKTGEASGQVGQPRAKTV